MPVEERHAKNGSFKNQTCPSVDVLWQLTCKTISGPLLTARGEAGKTKGAEISGTRRSSLIEERTLEEFAIGRKYKENIEERPLKELAIGRKHWRI